MKVKRTFTYISLTSFLAISVLWLAYVIKPYVNARRADANILNTSLIPNSGDLQVCLNGNDVVTQTEIKNQGVAIRTNNKHNQLIRLNEFTTIKWDFVHGCPQVNSTNYPILLDAEFKQLSVESFNKDGKLYELFRIPWMTKSNSDSSLEKFIAFSDKWIATRVRDRKKGLYIVRLTNRHGITRTYTLPELDSRKRKLLNAYIEGNYLVYCYGKKNNPEVWNTRSLATWKLLDKKYIVSDAIYLNDAGQINASLRSTNKKNKVFYRIEIFQEDGTKRTIDIGGGESSTLKNSFLFGSNDYIGLVVNKENEADIYVYKKSDSKYSQMIRRPRDINYSLVKNANLYWQEDISSYFVALYNVLFDPGKLSTAMYTKQGYVFKRKI